MSRGRHADHPAEIPPKGWKDILFRVKDELASDNAGLIAAGIAFYGLLALFPAIAALVALAGLITEPVVVANQLDSLVATLPPSASEIVMGQITSVAGADEGGLGIAALIGLLIAIWSASKGVDTMVTGLNVAYDEEEERGFIKRKLVVLGLTLALLVGLLLGLGVTAAIPGLLAYLGDYPLLETIAQWARWPILLMLAALGITLLYRWGPSRDPAKWRWLTPGSIVATLLWVAGSFAFTFYVENFGSYNETFGTLGGVVILLTWMWLSAFVILLGAELDSEMEAQTRADTTVGPREPMGRRGAEKADKLGESVA